MSKNYDWERLQLRNAIASDACSPEQLRVMLDEEIEKRKKQREAREKALREMRTGVLKPLVVQVWHPPEHSSYTILIPTTEYTYSFDLWGYDKLENFVTLNEE